MKLIGISGVARAGKDTFCKYIIEFLSEKELVGRRYALADNLKKDLYYFVQDKFNRNIFDLSGEDKEVIRPVMVGYGAAKRLQSAGTYWTSLVQKDLDFQKDGVAIVTDIRYCKYPKDEHYWLREKNNGSLIHIKRIVPGIGEIPYANSEEAAFDPLLEKLADYRISIPTFESVDDLRKFIFDWMEDHTELWKP